jgi:inner membrane transporter RhtA
LSESREAKAAGLSVPGPALVLVSSLSLQLGTALAKTMFAVVGVVGVVVMRTVFSALVLWTVTRPKVRAYSARQWRYAVLLGLTSCGMFLAFYAATARIPIGVAVAIEFLGPITVAVVGVRRAAHLVWPLLAYGGVLLLSPLHGLGHLDGAGALFALLAACGWAAYIVLMARTSDGFAGADGLALAMVCSAVATLPLLFLVRPTGFGDGSLLLRGFVVALLSVAVPFWLELLVLRSMSQRVFGVLLSGEPALAAVVGLVALGEVLSGVEWLAIGLVTAASVGVMVDRKAEERLL